MKKLNKVSIVLTILVLSLTLLLVGCKQGDISNFKAYNVSLHEGKIDRVYFGDVDSVTFSDGYCYTGYTIYTTQSDGTVHDTSYPTKGITYRLLTDPENSRNLLLLPLQEGTSKPAEYTPFNPRPLEEVK